MRLNGNTVLITGGGTGIGLALAEIFLKNGNNVIICGRSRTSLESAKNKFPELHTIVADVSSGSGRENLKTELNERFPKLNVLINNAGNYNIADFRQNEFIETFQNEVGTNLVAPVALSHMLLPLLEKQAASTIVNVTTGYVFLASAQSAGYSASKTALHVMTQGLRFQFRKSTVRIVEVVPPTVETEMSKMHKVSKMGREEFAQKVFKGLINGQDEIVIGMSKVAHLLARLAPKFGFRTMNVQEEKLRIEREKNNLD
tara:strand:- start:295 stop:1068 length:774 start_codon:yes stop_codon:yes gene_type:complete